MFGFKFCDDKVISQLVGTYSLIIGSILGLFLGFVADRTRIAPYFYISYIARGLSLVFLSTIGEGMTEGWIVVCFVALQTGTFC